MAALNIAGAGFGRRSCVIAAALAIALSSGCATVKPATRAPGVAAAPPPEVPAPHQLAQDQSEFLHLPNIPPGRTPVRVGIILPLTSSSPATRALANSMMKAAELALYDSENRNIILMSADDTGSAADAAVSARTLLAQGAEIIVGPLFSQSVSAVAPLARDKGVPVLAFSTDASVAGNGVYLLSFLPQTEVRRVISFAARQGHSAIGAMIPETPYGEVVAQAFRQSVVDSGAKIADIERFSPSIGAVAEPAATLAKSNPDAVLIAQGGALLRGIAPSLSVHGIDREKVKFMGTGLWDDPGVSREPLLVGGWFAAPEPAADRAFAARYRGAFGAAPSQTQLAALAYDAVSLVALLSSGAPYHRFSRDALTDPNGFSGVDGIFRLNADGTTERGLAILAVAPGGGFQVVDPAPRTFEKPAS
ncbi:MAG: penicillin-binding protein activator [Alphaproteobacteria bacterium]|nr:penicillin-binding protein activator [Alphaproteobacteria bacterium]